MLIAHAEPSSLKQALSQPQRFDVMKAEYESLVKNGTWVLTTLPAHRKIIGCKWVFKVNENLNGNVNKYKVRLVAKGNNMDLTSPRLFLSVIKPTTIHVILTVALTFKWEIQQVDINNAFFNRDMQKEVLWINHQIFMTLMFSRFAN